MAFDKSLLKILACPDCRGDIDYNSEDYTSVTAKYRQQGSKETLRCLKCRRIFQIKDGIPIMLPKAE